MFHKNDVQFFPLGIVIVGEIIIWVWEANPGDPLPMNLVVPFVVAIAAAALLGMILDYLIIKRR